MEENRVRGPFTYIGAGDANYFEPQFEFLLAYFNTLMVSYQTKEKDNPSYNFNNDKR